MTEWFTHDCARPGRGGVWSSNTGPAKSDQCCKRFATAYIK